MIYALKNATMRSADAETIKGGVPSEELMHRAGKALADAVWAAVKRLNAKSVLFVCGTGNNGGDGYVAARLLTDGGIKVGVFAAEYGKLSEDCLREKSAYCGEYSTEIVGDIVVDCLFGTGLSRAVSGEYAKVIDKINSSRAYVISADIPSGLNGDNGLLQGCAVKADETVAIAYPKLGAYLNDGLDYCGKITVCDIGIKSSQSDAAVVEGEDIIALLPERKRNTHKGSYGSCCVVAGSNEYLGACALSLSTALRSGCGYVYGVVPKKMKCALAVKYPQCIYVNKPVFAADAVAVGMGCGLNRKTYARVCKLIKSYGGKLIIDADGLNCLAKYGKEVLKQAKASVLITPHVGEMARLCGVDVGQVKSDPVGFASKFAKEYSVVVHLKSASCVTVEKDMCVITANGNTSLAKAGSGDLLSGLICGTAATGLSLFDAAVRSQYLLGEAAKISSVARAEGSITSEELAFNISTAINRLTIGQNKC